jgi:hypothetical protein
MQYNMAATSNISLGRMRQLKTVRAWQVNYVEKIQV